ncbi:F-box protein [Zea mays]|uniref:F-box protein n=1 Tax=Zea mays TaxID=4577 RepID=A0A1D6LFD6_MAIZE|nr:F-box protein [Zea mays]
MLLPPPRRRRILSGAPARPRAPPRPATATAVSPAAPRRPLPRRRSQAPPIAPPPPPPPRALAPPPIRLRLRFLVPVLPVPRRVRVGPARHSRGVIPRPLRARGRWRLQVPLRDAFHRGVRRHGGGRWGSVGLRQFCREQPHCGGGGGG